MLLQTPLMDYKQEDLSFELTDSHFAVTGYTSPVRKWKVLKFKHEDITFMKIDEITKKKIIW